MLAIPYFRVFNNADLSELEQMILALYQGDFSGEEMSQNKIWSTVQELVSHPEKGVITLFCVDDVVVGYAIIIYYWSNEYGGNIATIDEFYVKSSWREKGIGSSFLKHIATANAGNLKGIQLEVTPANEKAFTYYSRNGFSPKANRHLFMKL